MAKATRRSVRRISRTTSGFTAVISLRSKRRSAMDATAICRRGTRSSAPIAFVWSRRGFWRNRPTRRRRTTSARHECRSRAIESEIRARAAGRALRRGRVAILFRRGRGDDDVLRDCRSGGTGGDDLAADDDLSRGGLHDRILHVLGVHVLVESVHGPSFDRADQRRADRSRCAMIKTIPLALVEGDDGALYAKQPKVYPREIDGRFQRLRIAAVFWLLGMFYVFPWLSWNGHQLVLFDLPARKFHVFGLTFWPQDFFFLAWLLIMAGLSLFFFTAVAGRLWCGYACPQTVWTEVFLWIERKVEGDRNRRMKLDAAPWNGAKVARKSLKQFLWIAFALWTGFTFVGFFTPIRELAGEVRHLQASGWETFWILFYAFATYGNAGYLREQVCKYMCPYARFQGAMFDRDTLVISYDEARGEPRGSRRKTAERGSTGLGDCIDCLACVQVCPTGIDIRNGLQVGCIACAACIDACDVVMDKMAYPKGLIRYTTENARDGRPMRVLRPRTLIYASLLLA